MAKPSVHTFTKLVNEPFFIQCADNLATPNGVQAAEIDSIDDIRLERRVTNNPETWETAVDSTGFSSLQILDDDTFLNAMVAGVLNADPDTDPPPGNDYRIVVECTITFATEFGGGTTGRVFRRDARIPASALIAPAS